MPFRPRQFARVVRQRLVERPFDAPIVRQIQTAPAAVVEVRLREHLEFGGALASVTRDKRRKIIRTTQFFLSRHAQWRGLVVRFDVLGVQGLPDGTHRIAWIKDAFRAT